MSSDYQLLLSNLIDGFSNLKNKKSYKDVFVFLYKLNNQLKEATSTNSTKNYTHTESIIKDYYDQIISDWDTELISDVDNLFEDNKRLFINENFASLFDDFLLALNNCDLIRERHQFIHSNEIVELVENCIDLPKTAKVYNPFAGFGSFGLSKTIHNYFGQESDINLRNLAILRGLIHGKKLKIALADGLKNWNPENEKFDLIILASIPTHLGKHYKVSFGNYNSRTHLQEAKAMFDAAQSLTENGRIIFLPSDDFLQYGGYLETLKRKLLNNYLLKSIIAIPKKMFNNEKHRTQAILVFEKGRGKNDKVQIINFEELMTDKNGSNSIKPNKLLSSILAPDYFNQFLVEHGAWDNKFFGNDWRPKRFFNKAEGTSLSQILNEISFKLPDEIRKKDEFYFLDDEDLNEAEMDIDGLVKKDFPVNSLIIDRSCLLIGTMGFELKPTYFNYSGTPIVISPNIFACQVDTEKVDVDFLIHKLKSRYVLKQKQFYHIDTTGKITKTYLKRLKIKLPDSISEQRLILGKD